MFLPIVRSFWKKRVYQSLFGKKMLDGARFLIATSEQEADELASGGIPREKIFFRRNGVERSVTIACSRSDFARSMEFLPSAKVVLFLGRLSVKKSPESLTRSVCGARMPKCCRTQMRALCSQARTTKTSGRAWTQMANRLGVAAASDFHRPAFRHGEMGSVSRRRRIRVAVAKRKLWQHCRRSGRGRHAGCRHRRMWRCAAARRRRGHRCGPQRETRSHSASIAADRLCHARKARGWMPGSHRAPWLDRAGGRDGVAYIGRLPAILSHAIITRPVIV